jgi:hypothetical protein
MDPTDRSCMVCVGVEYGVEYMVWSVWCVYGVYGVGWVRWVRWVRWCVWYGVYGVCMVWGGSVFRKRV